MKQNHKLAYTHPRQMNICHFSLLLSFSVSLSPIAHSRVLLWILLTRNLWHLDDADGRRGDGCVTKSQLSRFVVHSALNGFISENHSSFEQQHLHIVEPQKTIELFYFVPVFARSILSDGWELRDQSTIALRAILKFSTFRMCDVSEHLSLA